MVATILLTAALSAADLSSVAALPGEPSIVSAAGLTRDDRPILTLENPDAFNPASTKIRAVLYAAGGNERLTAAVLEAIRWFKSEAPQELRDRWALSAIPSVDFDPSDHASFDRWVRFQVADVAIEIAAEGSPLIGLGVEGVQPLVVHTPFSGPMLASALRTAASQTTRSRLRDTMAARIARSPMDIARVLAARYPETPAISYIPALSWVAALRLSKRTGDASLRDRVLGQMQPWLSGDRKLFGDRIQLTSVAGTMAFVEIALEGHASAAPLADEGAALAARRKPTGIAEYGGGWTDDMFMASSVLARGSTRAGHAGDLDAAARLLVDYASRLQRPDGLFNHASDGPVAWGRGNGFAAFGLIEVLTAMPPDHPQRPALLDIYRRHMTAVRSQQAPDGMWREVIDVPGAYREETATAMLMTAMARGLRLGWLDASFAPAVARAWRALAAHVAADGTVIDVCASTGSGPTTRYYFDRQAITGGDDRGGAMAVTAAMELLDLPASILR